MSTDTPQDENLKSQETIEKQEQVAEESIDYKAEAEKLEAELKQAKEAEKEAEVANNQKIRYEKAKAKLEAVKTGEPVSKKGEMDVRDLAFLDSKEIAEDSDEAQVLKKYKEAGLIDNFKTGLDHLGVKAEIEAIKAQRTAEQVVDDADDEGYSITTKKDKINKFKTSNEIAPGDEPIIAKNNLDSMGL